MINSILSPRRVFLDLRPAPKNELLTDMAKRLEDLGEIQDAEALARLLIKREEVITTGVKRGFAFPHAFMPGMESLFLTIGLVREGVDFQSLDGSPVECILLLLGPPTQNHLRVLARLARIASGIDMIEAIRDVTTPQAMVELFASADQQAASVG